MSWQNNPQYNPGSQDPYHQGQQPDFPQATPAGYAGAAAGYASSDFSGRPAQLEEPQGSKTAKMLVLASAVVTLVQTILHLVFLDMDSFFASGFLEVELNGSEVTEEQALESASNFASTVVYGTTIVVLSITLGLYATVYFGMRANKNWARILGVVCAIVGGLLFFWTLLTSFIQFSGVTVVIVDVIAGLLGTAISVYFLILVFRKDVADWYRVQSLPQFST
ncbi:hypothetical protein [Auritidibacter ignavus]|uniref:hypothetical protein n=1 Tax=Auritidibacter ignavus TaxID=678932 RepID=UPI00109D73BB|nr:hypothetical protein [Auritidibacter ignavus]